jgi:hypothetical protein
MRQSLETLTLVGTQVTDAGLKELKELRRLRWLDVRATQVTDAGVRELKAARPAIQIRND